METTTNKTLARADFSEVSLDQMGINGVTAISIRDGKKFLKLELFLGINRAVMVYDHRPASIEAFKVYSLEKLKKLRAKFGGDPKAVSEKRRDFCTSLNLTAKVTIAEKSKGGQSWTVVNLNPPTTNKEPKIRLTFSTKRPKGTWSLQGTARTITLGPKPE